MLLSCVAVRLERARKKTLQGARLDSRLTQLFRRAGCWCEAIHGVTYSFNALTNYRKGRSLAGPRNSLNTIGRPEYVFDNILLGRIEIWILIRYGDRLLA